MLTPAIDVVDPRIGAAEVRERADDEQEYHKTIPNMSAIVACADTISASRGFFLYRSAQLIAARNASETLDDARDRLALADAHRGDPVPGPVASKLGSGASR